VSTGSLRNINRPHTQEFFFWRFAGGTKKTKDMYHRMPKQELTMVLPEVWQEVECLTFLEPAVALTLKSDNFL